MRRIVAHRGAARRTRAWAARTSGRQPALSTARARDETLQRTMNAQIHIHIAKAREADRRRRSR
jgi:hypothetical protein